MTLKRWDRWRLALSVLGALIAAYLSVQHYVSAVPLACSASGLVDCEQVLTSAYAQVAGVPVAVWGLLWFVAAATLAGLALSARHGADAPEPAWLRYAGIGWASIGAVAVIYLVYAELVLVGKICVWCSAVHVLVLALFVLQVLSDPARHRQAG